jgi:hypothetical protein
MKRIRQLFCIQFAALFSLLLVVYRNQQYLTKRTEKETQRHNAVIEQSSTNHENSFHRRLYSRFRELVAFTDEEVRHIIFLRHNAPPENRNATLSSSVPSDIVTGQPTTIGSEPSLSPSDSVTLDPTTEEPNMPSPVVNQPSTTPTDISTLPNATSRMPSPPTASIPSGTPVRASDQPSDRDTLEQPTTLVPSDSGSNRTSDVPTPAVPTSISDQPTISRPGSDIPTPPAPNEPTTLSPVGNGTGSVAELIGRTLTTDGAHLQDGTPQNNALRALETNFPDLDPITDEAEVLQTYALNTIYFSTNGSSWKTRTGWTGPTPICGDDSWFGIACNSDGAVLNLTLAENDLVGRVPSEIAGISTLGTSDEDGSYLLKKHLHLTRGFPLLAKNDRIYEFEYK